MKTILKIFSFVPVLLTLIACTQEPATNSQPTAGDSDDRIDLIILGDDVVTMDAVGTVIQNGAVAVDDGLILAVGSAAEITAAY